MDSARLSTRAALAAGYDNPSLLTDYHKNTTKEYAEGKWDASQVSTTTVLLQNGGQCERGSESGGDIYHGFYDRYFSGWRAGLIRSALVSTTAWLVNIAVYIYLFYKFNPQHGTGTLMQSTCAQVHRVDTIVHAVLNGVSTLVLGASTYAMEGLCSPTRAEVDAAHSKRRWVDIGVQSLRNLRWIGKERMALWLLLGVTSMPMHLFFNAVFYTSSQSNQYAVAVVSSEFFANDTWTPTSENTAPSLFSAQGGGLDQSLYERQEEDTIPELLHDAKIDAGKEYFKRLEPSECISSYSVGFVETYSDVVVVTSNQSDSMLLWSRYPLRSVSLDKGNTNPDPFHWVCHDYLKYRAHDSSEDRCNLEIAEQLMNEGNWTVYSNPVEYCLSRPSPDTCRLQFSAFLMAAVLVFGLAKTLVIIYFIFRRFKGQFLRTLGDAVSSFLQQEDDTTVGMCLVPSSDLSTLKWQEGYTPRAFAGRRPRWWISANFKQFCFGIGLSVVYVIVLSVGLRNAIDGAHGAAFDSGFGAPNIQSLASFMKKDDITSNGIVPNLLVANVPQLGFSILYIVYNDIYSKMLIGQEFDRFSQHRKALRVSERPKGMQRTSRFFTIHARYAIPLLAASALLHWLASRSLFLVRIDGIDSDRRIDTEDQLVRLGYNARGIIGLVAVSAWVTAITIFIGGAKRTSTGLGETCNSAIISAACHTQGNERDSHLKALCWGDVTADEGYGGVRHCAFTSGHAIKPIPGQLYS